MAYDKAKERLRDARTPQARREAIREAIREGMPLHAIEQFLDWLDATQGPVPGEGDPDPPTSNDPPQK